MGLIALEDATGHGFREAINRGLSWIAGANALQNDLRSPDRGLIWDSIRTRRWRASVWDAALHLLHVPQHSGTDQLGFVATPARPLWVATLFLRKSRHPGNTAGGP